MSILSKKESMRRQELPIVKKLVRSNIRGYELELSDKEVEFFAKYPFEIDRLTSTMATKKIYIGIAMIIGVMMVLLSILIENHRFFEGGMMSGLGTDLLFEGGVALWGAAITVYLLEIVMHKQELINRHYRVQIQKRVREYEKRNEGS